MFSVILKMISYPHLFIETIKTFIEIRSNKIPDIKADKFESFVNNYLDCRFYTYPELKKLGASDEYHMFICGSDQVWSSTALYVDPMMYLRFSPKNKRIAYAPSLGRNYIPEYNVKQMKRYIEEFDSISVREQDGQCLVSTLIGKSVSLVLDPTLLLKKSEWDLVKLESPYHNYILCYFLDSPKQEFINWLFQFATSHNLVIVTLNHNIPLTARVLVEIAGIEEFIGLVSASELVLTDSYHGMLFSIIYQKKFWCIERNYAQHDQSSRQKSLLKLLGLGSRYVIDSSLIDMSDIDYVQVTEKLDKERESSFSYLTGALNKRK